MTVHYSIRPLLIYREIFNSRYDCVAKWKAHDQLILASTVTNYKGRAIYVTGGNDNCVAIWQVSDSIEAPQKVSLSGNGSLYLTYHHWTKD